MSGKGLPPEIEGHPEAEVGRFFWLSWKQGAVRFGMMARNAKGEAEGPFYPLNWPGAVPAGCHFEYAVEWPEGNLTIHRPPPSVSLEDQLESWARTPAEVDAAEITLATTWLGILEDFTREQNERQWFEARQISAKMPALDGPAAPDLARAFMAGVGVANLLANQKIQILLEKLAKQKGKAKLDYGYAARLALQLHPGLQAKQLLVAIGARPVLSGKALVWRDFADREVLFDDWRKAVNSAAQ